MTTRLITPPVAMAVSLEAARLAARADAGELDAEITTQVKAITEEAEHYCGRAFIEQTWRVTLDRFPEAIQLPHPPLVLVDYVKFYDEQGVQQTLDPQDYQVDAASEPGYLVPAPGKAWPAIATRINAVEAQYKCGYGSDDTTVPDSVKGYILARVQAHFEGSEPNEHLVRMLDRCKVY
jgi:uncharacterized phiE125 gp8 family phage protein